ncbi:L-rhamnose mutarotase [Pelagibacterium flavum]|uniref:L-rhamnose mutarotase n=1 Tax=Pelagibacterium flavum TaxID=2984530 RepID=A0ABY6IM15_9HYPH|nr:L-rhamnose mutarotase [Pelagibacterium sp. YIM 151497]UYQ71642.1 L-rhamnose mutarotase [Pelagibacterium sp. YIM 151497]|tara:strand:- start:3002 stop:3319 length:318 start_codon:yes stop_codon:yes gene_type:complete
MGERIAFRMILNPGQADEYKRRHDAIWPQLAELLKSSGISDYTIWLDPETNHLFATLVRAENHAMDRLPETEIMGRWWAMMGDIMETNPDSSPVQVELIKMFELP